MRRIFVAMLAALAVVLSGCGAVDDVSKGVAYYTSDERKSMMTGPYDRFAMRVQDAMQSGQLGEIVAYKLPQKDYFPWMCASNGEQAPRGYVGAIQVCTLDGRYTLSGVTVDSPQFAEGKVFAVRAKDIDAAKDKDSIISGRYKDGSGKLMGPNSISTRSEITTEDERLIQVFRSRPLN